MIKKKFIEKYIKILSDDSDIKTSIKDMENYFKIKFSIKFNIKLILNLLFSYFIQHIFITSFEAL